MHAVDPKDLVSHSSRQSCWVAINGVVWDVTDFVDKHPGGASMILKVAGQDATEEYETFHNAELVEETLSPEARLGTVDAEKIPKIEPKSKTASTKKKSPPLGSMISVNDFEKVAEQTMTTAAWAYVSSGADDELSMRDASEVYSKIYLRGRVLRAVGEIDTSTTILGQHSSLPIYTSPVGLAKLVHPSGECAIAAADGKEGVIQVVNTVSSMPIEAIMDARIAKDQPVFWQLYVDKDLQKSKAFVERVEKCGVKSIWVTVDSPVIGNRERDERSKEIEDVRYHSPSQTTIANNLTGRRELRRCRQCNEIRGYRCFEHRVRQPQHRLEYHCFPTRCHQAAPCCQGNSIRPRRGSRLRAWRRRHCSIEPWG